MSRSSDDELRSLHKCFSPSVVRLAVYKGDEDENVLVNLGTGIILGEVLPGLGKRSRTAQNNCIFVLTTMACHEEDAKESDNYQVSAKVDDSEELKALVFETSGIFTVLVVMCIPDEYMKDIIALNDASFYKGGIQNAEPVVVVGCFSGSLKEIAPSGYVSISDIDVDVGMDEGAEPSRAFTHSCPIGDGLIGAPVINRFWKIIGLNYDCSPPSSKVNYALKLEELSSVLAQILKEDPKKPMSSLLETLRKQFFDFIRDSKAKKTDGASSSSATTK